MPELEFNKILIKEKKIEVEDIEELLRKRKLHFMIKRMFDVVISFFGLIFLTPVFVIISIAIKMDSKGLVLFKQMRVGKGGKEFEIFKFRTMITDSEKKGMQITVGNDSRITKAGNFLRKTKLDELPQLINVFIGDMSFVLKS